MQETFQSISAKNPIKPLVCVAVDNHMVYGLVVLLSAIKQTSVLTPTVFVGYFPGELNKRNQAFIQQYLVWLSIPFELVELERHPLFSARRHLTITTFAKFLLADRIPERHLWLDLDTLVLPGWEEIFARIDNASSETNLVVGEMVTSKYTRFQGFNAGVLGWTRAPRKAWLSALSRLPEKRFSSEQVLFNSLYGKSIEQVDSSFNFLSSWHREIKRNPLPKIIHYSGPIKPWHLSRRYKKAWEAVNSTWKWWFEAEDHLFERLDQKQLRRAVKSHRDRALFSGRLHLGKGSLAGWVMKFLAVAGPLGAPAVKLLATRAQR